MDENTNAATATEGGSKTMYVVIAVIVLVLIGWLIMRGGSDEADTKTDDASPYVSENGTDALGVASIPSNWPDDVPTYAGADIQYSGTSNPATGKSGAAMVFATKDSADTVLAFYKEKLVANGWTIAAEANTNGMITLGATKDSRAFGMYIAPSGEGTETTVTVGVEGV
jgi:hypothetical protein